MEKAETTSNGRKLNFIWIN